MPEPHIVMLNKAYPPWVGGIERHVGDISRELARRDWCVSVLVCNDAGYSSREQIHGVQVIRVPSHGTFLSQPFTLSYYRELRRLQPNLVHVHVPFPLGWRAAAKVPVGIPLFCTWHSEIIRQRFLRPFYSPFEQKFLRRCHRIIATSEPLRDSSIALRRHKEKTEIIPLAIPDRDKAFLLSSTALAHENKQQYPGSLILSVGRLVGYKGLEYLIRAMKTVEATLLIAGEGPLRPVLENLAQQLNLHSKVHFLGGVSEMEKWALYQAADVFALPSIGRNEAFGYVLLEAMSAGCPIVTTDLPTGVRIVNREGESGLVVPPKNSDALADALNRILGDDNLRQTLSQGAKARVEREFSFARSVNRLEELYREALNYPTELKSSRAFPG